MRSILPATTALLLSTLAHAHTGKIAFDVQLTDVNGLWQYTGPWTFPSTIHETPAPGCPLPRGWYNQIQLNRTGRGDILALDTWCTSITVFPFLTLPVHDAVIMNAEGAKVLYEEHGRYMTAQYDTLSPAHISIRSNLPRSNTSHPDLSTVFLLQGANVTTQLETEATTFEDVSIYEEAVVYDEYIEDVGEWSQGTGARHHATITVPPGTAFVQLMGNMGAPDKFGPANVTLSSSNRDAPQITSKIYRPPACDVTALLWMAPLDPTANYTLTVATTGKGKLGLTSIVYYASEWDKPCSESARPAHCRWIRIRRWVANNWILGGIALFMFFLIKGLLWLALGGGLFMSLRELWRRVRKPTEEGEREPLLQPTDAEEQGVAEEPVTRRG